MSCLLKCFRFFSDLPAKLLDLTDDQHIYAVPGKILL